MKCLTCKNEDIGDSKFCTNCGAVQSVNNLNELNSAKGSKTMQPCKPRPKPDNINSSFISSEKNEAKLNNLTSGNFEVNSANYAQHEPDFGAISRKTPDTMSEQTNSYEPLSGRKLVEMIILMNLITLAVNIFLCLGIMIKNNFIGSIQDPESASFSTIAAILITIISIPLCIRANRNLREYNKKAARLNFIFNAISIVAGFTIYWPNFGFFSILYISSVCSLVLQFILEENREFR